MHTFNPLSLVTSRSLMWHTLSRLLGLASWLRFLASWFGFDPSVVRLCWVLLTHSELFDSRIIVLPGAFVIIKWIIFLVPLILLECNCRKLRVFITFLHDCHFPKFQNFIHRKFQGVKFVPFALNDQFNTMKKVAEVQRPDKAGRHN